MTQIFGLILVILDLIEIAFGHGRMIEPPMRSSMWRYGFDTPKNYNDNELNCGGFGAMMDKGRGRCGPCGDPFWAKRENEAGGKYALGVIAKQYRVGEIINVTIELTTNHKGYFEFRLCPNNDPYKPVTEECLNRFPLNIIGYGKRYMLYNEKIVMVDLQLMLPPRLSCSQCVLQWKWRAAQNRGIDPISGKECFGCGPQEYFINCADIAIGDKAIKPIKPVARTKPIHKPAARASVSSKTTKWKAKAPKAVTITRVPTNNVPRVNANPVNQYTPTTQNHQYNMHNHEINEEAIAERVFLDLIGQNTLFVDTGPHFDAFASLGTNLFTPSTSVAPTNAPVSPVYNDFITPSGGGIFDVPNIGIPESHPPMSPQELGQYYSSQSVMAAAAILSTLAGEAGSDSALIECHDGRMPTCKGNTLWGQGPSNDKYCASMCPQGQCPMSMCTCTCPSPKKIYGRTSNPTTHTNDFGKCFAIEQWDQNMNTWCAANCKITNIDACPTDLCTCDIFGM